MLVDWGILAHWICNTDDSSCTSPRDEDLAISTIRQSKNFTQLTSWSHTEPLCFDILVFSRESLSIDFLSIDYLVAQFNDFDEFMNEFCFPDFVFRGSLARCGHDQKFKGELNAQRLRLEPRGFPSFSKIEKAQRFGNFEFHTWFIDEDADLVLQLDLVFLQTLVPFAANIEEVIC